MSDAGGGQLAARLRAAAALLDDEALAALANRGLVRRARKDLEAAQPAITGEEGNRLVLEIESCQVRVTEPLAQSRCSCPAGGGCRHVLAALMFLRQQGAAQPAAPEGSAKTAAAPAAAPRAGQEIEGVDDESLRRWAGAAVWRRAQEELGRGLVVELVDGPVLVARFPDLAVECRYLVGAGLDGMLCGCHAPPPCLHRLAAVLAWQSQTGARPPIVETVQALAASGEVPRSRDEIRAAVRELTEELVVQGLARITEGTRDRLRGLSSSANGVDLPRLARLLRALADDVDAWLQRDARASDELLLSRAADAHALAQALAHPTPALVGVHRQRYEKVRELELVGAGARAWRSPGGYAGLTVYFWERNGKRWTTWTEARPLTVEHFDPAQRFTAPGPWAGCESPAAAARTHFRLAPAWRSRAGRLSGRTGTHQVPLGDSVAGLLPAPIRDWSELDRRAHDALARPAGDADELASLLLVAPDAWGPALFDTIAQELRRPLFDARGRGVPLVVPQSPETSDAIAHLERLDPEPGALVLGTIQLLHGRIAILPISIIGATVTSLGLGRQAKAVITQAPAAAVTEGATEGDEAEELDVDEEKAVPLQVEGPVSTALALVWADLEAAASAGLRAFRGWERLRQLGTRLDAMGLAHAARALTRLHEARQGHSRDRARAVLSAARIVRASRLAVTIEHAAADLR